MYRNLVIEWTYVIVWASPKLQWLLWVNPEHVFTCNSTARSSLRQDQQNHTQKYL